MVFERIVSIVGLRWWIRRKTWKRSQVGGRAFLNVFRNGQGLKINYIVVQKDKTKLTFDMPANALKKIADICKEEGFWPQSKNKQKWKLQDWREYDAKNTGKNKRKK